MLVGTTEGTELAVSGGVEVGSDVGYCKMESGFRYEPRDMDTIVLTRYNSH